MAKGGAEAAVEIRKEQGEHEPLEFELVGIFTADKKGEPMVEHDSIMAIAGQGLEGDRYAKREGLYSGKPAKRKNGQIITDDDRQVTLISLMGIKLASEYLGANREPAVTAAQTRRNLAVNVGVNSLNDLVGQRFRVGSVVMEGVELCAPCKMPARYAGRPKENEHLFEEAFENKGGLRARILTTGELRKGDYITLNNS